MMTEPSHADIHAAALQYVRKVTGFREPSKANHAEFYSAVEEIANTTSRVLDRLVIRGRTK